jgi:glucose-1-phosphate cytidylyltransferase
MVEIGGKPVLWHIMQHYSHFGFREFLIALGYKGDIIKKYFIDYSAQNGDLTIDLRSGNVTARRREAPDWRIHLVETGLETQTGGRIKRLGPYIGTETFMLTWGDGLSDVDLNHLLAFHRSHGKLATLTAVPQPARFGQLDLSGKEVVDFREKPASSNKWINGAFFVLEPEVLDLIEGDHTQWEKEPLEELARRGQLIAYRHSSFWQCMDTLRDLRLLQELWASGQAPWRVWQ